MIKLYNYCPTLDLHGYDREYARIAINEFIEDNYRCKNQRVIIIHGIGTGILRKITQETLKKNRIVDSFKIDNFNSGETVVELKKSIDK